MTLWHNATIDLPAMAVGEYEESGIVYEYRESAPQLVLFEDGSMTVAVYEEDSDLNFRAWVDLVNRSTLTGVKYWTQLPKPPKEGKR